MKTTTKYSPDVREGAVRLVLEHQDDHEPDSDLLDCPLRRWVRQADRSIDLLCPCALPDRS